MKEQVYIPKHGLHRCKIYAVELVDGELWGRVHFHKKFIHVVQEAKSGVWVAPDHADCFIGSRKIRVNLSYD